MSATGSRFIASGTINPATIVKADPAGNFHVLQAAALTDKLLGVAQEGTFYAPGVVGAPTYAATTGQPITVYGDGEECLVKVSTSAVTAGDALKTDANGLAVTVAFTAGSGVVWTVGEALESANPGELVRVLVRPYAIEGITA